MNEPKANTVIEIPEEAEITIHISAHTHVTGIYQSIHLNAAQASRIPQRPAVHSMIEIPFGKYIISLVVGENSPRDGRYMIYSSPGFRVKVECPDPNEPYNKNKWTLVNIWNKCSDGEILVLPKI